MSPSSATGALHCELVSPQRTQQGEEHLWSSSHQLQPLPMVSLEERKPRMGKTQDPGPRDPRCNQRNDFSKPRLLHLSIHRKVLNCLIGDRWFSLINNHLSKKIYFWLCWVFVAWGMLCLAVVSRGFSSLWSPGFSLQSWALGCVGFRGCSMQAQQRKNFSMFRLLALCCKASV